MFQRSLAEGSSSLAWDRWVNVCKKNNRAGRAQFPSPPDDLRCLQRYLGPWWKGRKRGVSRSEGSATETACQRTPTTAPLALRSSKRRDLEHFASDRADNFHSTLLD